MAFVRLGDRINYLTLITPCVMPVLPDTGESCPDAPVDPARINAITATDAVTEALKATVPAIHGAVCDARIFQIPTQALDQDSPPTSPITALTGDAGVIEGAAALRAMDYREHQHAMATVRCPGVIQVERDMKDVIAAVNVAKQALRVAMTAFGRSGWTLWRGRIPAWQRLNRLQAYREWHWLDEPVRKIGFSWAGHTHGSEQLRIAELRDRLSRQNRASGHPLIEAELAKLDGFDGDEVVVIRKPIAPTPIANVAFADGRRRVIKTGLPIVLCHNMPIITALPDFDPAKKARTRDDQTIESLLVAYWHAWRYQPAYRFRLSTDPISARVSFDSTSITLTPSRQASIFLARPGRQKLAEVSAALIDARGPVPGAPPLDAGGTVQVVAANRVNAYLVSRDRSVWRVPRADLMP